MENKTKLILSISAIVVAAAAILLFVFSKKATPPATQIPSGQQSPTTFPIPSPRDPKMTINTSQGSFDVNNVYQAPLKNLSNDGVAFKDNADYSISYYPQNQGFLIVIQNPDIEGAYSKLESDFLQTLGIDKDTACKLTVSITVPYSINASASGHEYGFRFCSGGRPFPTK